jgi:hypothetical protein
VASSSGLRMATVMGSSRCDGLAGFIQCDKIA